MDANRLPAHPSVKQFEKLAEDIASAYASGDSEALLRIKGHYELERTPTWEELRAHVAGRLRRLGKWSDSEIPKAELAPADAHLLVAHAHGFKSWRALVEHIEAMNQAHSPVSRFEAAVDAVITGDVATLASLLREDPELIRARSTREHRSTLLHYVSANGVEDFRQKTPNNIVEITKLLLDAGADVNAESDAYGGRSTTLGLTATSWHPENAGVQLPLMELLIERGAIIDGPDGGSAVNGCLHNGRGEAAEFLAQRGARLDLEGAAGVGRLDVVNSFFNEDGSPKPPATPQQMQDGFAWACEFGRTSVVEFLLQRGMEVDAKLKHNGQTGLHWAALGGHADTVELLLEHGTPVDTRDESYDGTPLGWALYGWGCSTPRQAERGRYYDVVALLSRAGAKLDPKWFEDDEDRQRAATKMRSDPRMLAALSGQMPTTYPPSLFGSIEVGRLLSDNEDPTDDSA
ncbi:MAG TPA: ankyrin repeat domain-containing protein [Blastocatellia bacterium]|nr:ankyrin repeat domain-containing protein [Blastocatellia bacterium]